MDQSISGFPMNLVFKSCLSYDGDKDFLGEVLDSWFNDDMAQLSKFPTLESALDRFVADFDDAFLLTFGWTPGHQAECAKMRELYETIIRDFYQKWRFHIGDLEFSHEDGDVGEYLVSLGYPCSFDCLTSDVEGDVNSGVNNCSGNLQDVFFSRCMADAFGGLVKGDAQMMVFDPGILFKHYSSLNEVMSFFSPSYGGFESSCLEVKRLDGSLFGQFLSGKMQTFRTFEVLSVLR